jgi:hypothetical protein
LRKRFAFQYGKSNYIKISRKTEKENYKGLRNAGIGKIHEFERIACTDENIEHTKIVGIVIIIVEQEKHSSKSVSILC